MSQVRIENDGKGKYQSFSATIDLPTSPASMGFFSGEIVGYGATEKEALANLDEQARAASLFIARGALEAQGRMNLIDGGIDVATYAEPV